MININRQSIANVIANNSTINSIYSGIKLVWSRVTGYLSCFNNVSNHWDDNLPWMDEVPWQD